MDHYSKQLLEACFYRMSQEARADVMRQVPEAYNAYFGREIVKVVRTEDGSELGSPR